DVRVLAKYGAEGAREVQADLGLDLHLLDAGLPVLHRILDGDHVLARRLDELERGVKGGGLATSRGPRHEHHAPRPPDALQEYLELLLLEAQVLDAVALDHRRLLEQPQHHLLPVDGGKRGHAEVELHAVDAGGEAPVLGQPTLRDVEARDDLDAGHHGEMELAGDLEEIEEEAVDAVADARAIVVRLYVNIRGAVEGGTAEHIVDHAHHRRIIGLALNLANVDGALRLGRGGADGEAEVHLERGVEPLARGQSRGRAAVGLLDGVLDGAGRTDAEVDVEPGGAPQIVHGHHVQRV